MALMSLNDTIFLELESREAPMHVGGLQLFEPPPGAGPELLAEVYARMLATTDLDDRLTRRCYRSAGGVGPWMWERDDQVDLEHHVRHSALPHPHRVRELLALVSRLHGTPLHRSRPLWEMHLIEGLEDGRFAIYTKVHHAMMDGMAGMRMAQDVLSTDPDERDMPTPVAARARAARDTPEEPEPDADEVRPSRNPVRRVASAVSDVVGASSMVLGTGEAALRNLWKAFRDEAVAAPYKAPRSILNVPITGARRFAAESYAIERFKAITAASGCTFNDAVLAVCSGALRRYLDELGELPEDPLIAMVPVALRKGEDAGGGGNMVGMVLANLATHLPDPQDRLALVRESMQKGKLGLEGLSPTQVVLLSGLVGAGTVLGPLYRFEPLRKPPYNIVISNVPGPSQPLYYDGARLVGSYPLSIPLSGQAMNITVVSYDGHLQLGITGCRETLPSMQRMLLHFEDSLAELESM